MPVFSTHLFKNLLFTFLFTTLILTGIVILVQSLRFLEIIIQAGAPATTFVTMILYAVPRLLEIIIPLALFAAIIFVYNKMSGDSEIVIMRNAGASPFQLAMPAIILALGLTIIMYVITTWMAPTFLSKLQTLKHVARGEYSSLLFRPGVFNTIDNGITIYVRERGAEGVLKGIMVYDARESNEYPVTIMASKGQAFVDDEGHKVVVYNGMRQQFDAQKKVLSKLNFDQYNIFIPDQISPVSQRWKEPNERTLIELLNPDLTSKDDRNRFNELFVEAHRRITTPLLTMIFALIGTVPFLFGSVKRRGYANRIFISAGLVLIFQGLFLAGFNFAKSNLAGVPLMYLSTILPIIILFIVYSNFAERFMMPYLVRRSPSS